MWCRRTGRVCGMVGIEILELCLGGESRGSFAHGKNQKNQVNKAYVPSLAHSKHKACSEPSAMQRVSVTRPSGWIGETPTTEKWGKGRNMVTAICHAHTHPFPPQRLLLLFFLFVCATEHARTHPRKGLPDILPPLKLNTPLLPSVSFFPSSYTSILSSRPRTDGLSFSLFVCPTRFQINKEPGKNNKKTATTFSPPPKKANLLLD